MHMVISALDFLNGKVLLAALSVTVTLTMSALMDASGAWNKVKSENLFYTEHVYRGAARLKTAEKQLYL